MRKLAIIFSLALLWGATAQAAAVTHAVTTTSTANTTSYASGAFTPAANDLLVAFVVASATTATGTMTDSQGLGFTKVTSRVYNSSAETIYLFVANNLAAASSMTVTFDCTGDAATGVVIFVARVSGMTRTGTAAIRQSSGQNNLTAGTTPAPVFAAAALTGNPTLGVVGNLSNPAALTEPTGWTERGDTGFASPTRGGEYVSRDSGFTGTTITWGSAGATAKGDISVELDTSAAAARNRIWQSNKLITSTEGKTHAK